MLEIHRYPDVRYSIDVDIALVSFFFGCLFQMAPCKYECGLLAIAVLGLHFQIDHLLLALILWGC